MGKIVKAKTLYDKIWESHLVKEMPNGFSLLYVDRHLIHEVTSAQAFSGLSEKQHSVRQPLLAIGTMDHVVPTAKDLIDVMSAEQRNLLALMHSNCETHGIPLFDLGHTRQGIVHVIGPELGFILPGTIVVCGDSHASTHGAFGALAFGIGASEIEHVLVTQTLVQKKQKTFRITVEGRPNDAISAKDIILKTIQTLGVSSGNGYVVEFCGSVIENLSMEQRMTLCNMSVELGAKAGLIAPDQKTIDYIKGRQLAPKGDAWLEALADWTALRSDNDAIFDKEASINVDDTHSFVTWGTSPEHAIDVTSLLPFPEQEQDENRAQGMSRAYSYMQLTPGMRLDEVKIDVAFVGSCTNSRIEDLRAAATQINKRRVSPTVKAIIVPGSMEVKKQAEAEGLHTLFEQAGFEWRLPGCSLCVAINNDTLSAGTRCISTSNRNFENRQGKGVLTHLASPRTVVESAIKGHIANPAL